jgi:hypothetical protein
MQPVRNRQHRAVRERAPNRPLNQRIARVVHVARGLIKHQDAAAAQQSTRHAQQLALAAAEVVAALLNGRVQASLQEKIAVQKGVKSMLRLFPCTAAGCC